MQEDDDVAVNITVSFDIILGYKSATVSCGGRLLRAGLLVWPRSNHICMGVPREDVGAVGKAYRHASVARVWEVLEEHRPHWLLAVTNMRRQRLCMGLVGSLVSAKVVTRQLLDQLGVVERGGDRCWLVLLGRRLRSNSLGAPAAVVQARLLGLALGLVYDASLENATRLHGRNARQYLQHLVMATGGDLAIQQQLVHGEQSSRAAESVSRRGRAVC